MKFQWDEKKRRANLKKHGVDFVDVADGFDHLTVVGLDDSQDYGEDRWVAVGFLREILIVVIFVVPEENTIRLISARKAEPREYENLHT